jgi:hypothetical protein
MACSEKNEDSQASAVSSAHSVVVQAHLPLWYSDGALKRKKELQEWELSLPVWFKNLPLGRRQALVDAHKRSMDALNKMDRVFSHLKGAVEFVEPLLQAAIQQKFARTVDVKRLFFARREFMPADRAKVFGPQASGYCYYRGVSLVEAAMQNFSADETVESKDRNSRVITRYDFHQQPGSTTFNESAVLVREEPLKPHLFAELCRELDLGALYLAHVTSIVNPPTRVEFAAGSSAANVHASLTASTRLQLLLAAEVAMDMGGIQPDSLTALRELAYWKVGVKWRGKLMHFSNLKLLNIELKQIIVIGPVSYGYVRGVKVFSREPCIVYIPADPVCVLKEYAGLGELKADLVDRLCSARYRQFFSQYVRYEQQTKFFTALKLQLDPNNVYAENADFDPAEKRTGTWSTGYGEVMPNTWTDHSQQKADLLVSNAKAMVIPTAMADEKAHNAWLVSLAGAALTVLNVASFVVPQLAPVMLAIGAVQMLYEIATGAEAWEEGDMKAVWAHVSTVAFNMTTVVLGAKLMPLIKTPFVEALSHVRCPDAKVRLYTPGLKPYLRQVALPPSVVANAHGLFEHTGGLYLPENDAYFLLEPSGADNTYKILHPENPATYSPLIRRTKSGGWIHEHENPLQWTAPQLMERLGPTAQRFIDTPEKLERICQIAAVDSSVLRKMHVDQAAPPGMLADMLKRFEIDEAIAGEAPTVNVSLLPGHQADLFAQRYAALETDGSEAASILQREFGTLPDPVVQEILSHATDAEMQRIEQHKRVPLRLAEEARSYQQEVRLARAYEGLYRKTLGNDDTQRMVLHSLDKLEGWPTDLRIEVVEKGVDGAEHLLDSLGPQNATVKRRLVKFGPRNLYEVQDDRFGILSSQADIYGAVHTAILPADRVRLHLEPYDRGASLKQALEKTALMPRSELRSLLNMQPIKPGYKPPMRLADGRIGYPLSPLPTTPRRPLACVLKAAQLYPSKPIEQVEEFLGLAGLADAEVLARLTDLEVELQQLRTTLSTWRAEGGTAYGRARNRVSNRILDAWQRSTRQASVADQAPIGHILDLSDEKIGELPTLSANMDHVGSLILSRMSLSDASLGFLKAFGGLRWLSMDWNRFTQFPEFANNGIGLTRLDLSSNYIQLTALAKARLEGMHGLNVLNLAHNAELGWAANLEGLWSLNQLNLRATGTTRFPTGAGQLANLASIDLHSNQLSTLPEYAFEHIDRIDLHDNPLSADTLERIGGGFPRLEHVTAQEAKDLWLNDTPTAERAARASLWDDVVASPRSAGFFTVLADTTRCIEYRSATARAQLTERVWDMIEAVSERQAFREQLFGVADDRITCGDGSVLEFMNLESELLVLQSLELVGAAGAETQLITTARKLFRLKLVDAIAQRDINARGPAFREQAEVILAYRVKLAQRLSLPVKSRDMLYPAEAGVSQTVLDDAVASVQRDERIHDDEDGFFIEQGFWDRHLRSRYASELEALMAPGIEPINEKSAALYELADVERERDVEVDPAAQGQWLVKRNEAVETLVTLLGKRRDEILVNDSMPSVFFENQLQALATARRALERQALKTLTRRVLNNYAAMEGASL